MRAVTGTLVGSLCAALTLGSCGSAPAEAQPWQVIVQPGGYKVARGATAGAGLVEGIGLTCERGVAMIALDLPRARGRMPVLLSLSDGRSIGKLGVVRNGATTVWAGPVRDPRVLAMLARAASVDVAINGVRYGKVSLAGAADAMRGALGGCWTAGAAVVAQGAPPAKVLPSATAPAAKPMLPIKTGYYVATFDKQCAKASSALYYNGGNRLGDTSEPLRTIESAIRDRDGEYSIEFTDGQYDDVAGGDGMLIKPINADRIKVTGNDFTEMRLCPANTLPKRLLVGAVSKAAQATTAAAAAQTPVRALEVMAPVEAGKGCPALAPIDAWGRRNVENFLYNEVFCGDFDRDGRADALAFVNYQLGGNNQGHEAVLFRNVGGTLRFLRRVPDLSGGPQTATFTQGKVVLGLITMRPGDARCCPSGRTRVVVNVATGTHNQPR